MKINIFKFHNLFLSNVCLCFMMWKQSSSPWELQMWSLHAADSIYYTIWRIIALLHDCDEFLCAEVCSGVEITRNFIIWAWLYLFFLLLSFLYCFSLFNSAWLGPSKSAHPPNAIHHGTLSHLIATPQIASAPQISHQCWSSGSQQSCYSYTKNHRIKEVLSRFLAGNPPLTPSFSWSGLIVHLTPGDIDVRGPYDYWGKTLKNSEILMPWRKLTQEKRRASTGRQMNVWKIFWVQTLKK